MNIPRALLDQIHPEAHEYHEAFMVVNADAGVDETPLIVTAPHAGQYVPDPANFVRVLRSSLLDLRRRGDTLTDVLAENSGSVGATRIVSTVAPSFLNVGRDIDSIDPVQVRGGLKTLKANPNDIYIGAGQGLVATRTYHSGKPLYKWRKEPDAREIIDRIERFHTPFHHRIEEEVAAKLKKFGLAFIFDIHSCPTIGTHAELNPGTRRPDVILSNAGLLNSCPPEVIERAAALAEQFGYSVGVNDPFKGGYITQKFGAHRHAQHGLNTQTMQIEFARATYGLDEDSLQVKDGARFREAQEYLTSLMSMLADYTREQAAPGQS